MFPPDRSRAGVAQDPTATSDGRPVEIAVLYLKRPSGGCIVAAESARLESVWGNPPWFESHSLRHDADEAMDIALTEARAALAHTRCRRWEPWSCWVIGLLAARTMSAALNDPTAHSGSARVADASAAVGSWHLDGATLVVTLEPCVMCAGAAVNARVARVVFGAADLKAGSAGSLYNVFSDPRLNHNPEVISGVRARDAATLLEQFFSQKRS